jgi:hypothetical protein
MPAALNNRTARRTIPQLMLLVALPALIACSPPPTQAEAQATASIAGCWPGNVATPRAVTVTPALLATPTLTATTTTGTGTPTSTPWPTPRLGATTTPYPRCTPRPGETLVPYPTPVPFRG